MSFLVLILHVAGFSNSYTQQITLSSELDTLSNTTKIELKEAIVSEVQLTNPMTFLDEDLITGEIVAVTTDAKSQLFIADGDLLSIHVFDSNGNYQTSVGRSGEGPGEFRSLIDINVRGQTLYALDRNLNRITQFDTESLEVLKTIGLSGATNRTGMQARSMPEIFFALPNDRVLLSFSMYAGNTGRMFFQPVDILNAEGLYEGAGEIKIPVRQSVMRETGGKIGVMVPPYGRKGTLAASKSGQIYTNWSENLLIKKYDDRGNYIQSLYANLDGPPLSRRSLSERYNDTFMEYISGETLPDTWPVVRTFMIDDQERLWISLYSSDLDEAEWIVVQQNGTVLSKLILPSSNTIEKISGDEIYISEEDDEGFDVVKRYNFEW